MQTTEILDFTNNIIEDLVREQLEKILDWGIFSDSVVLSRFLKYIVTETLAGRSANIKEYNIVTDVLKKPRGSYSYSSGIVRVHARRLRLALAKYYESQGREDICIITMPKGRYVPTFESLQNIQGNITIPNIQIHQSGKIRLAIFPFTCFETDATKLSITENIGLLLNSKMGNLNHLSLLSYFSIHQNQIRESGIKLLATQYSLQYILAGRIQFEISRVRLIIQLIDSSTENQIWSEVYDLETNGTDIFILEENIVSKIMNDLAHFDQVFSQNFYAEEADPTIETTKRNVYFLNKFINQENCSRKTV
jgi:adenylate cyclase